MTLQLKVDDEIIVNLIENDFKEEESYFLFKGNSSTYGEIFAKINYPLKIVKQYNKDDYEIHLFFNKSFAENDIYQVYEHDVGIRIGWVFPLQALLSNNHAYIENEHFLPYAFVAYEKLLLEEHSDLLIPNFNVGDKYTLGDFYSVDETIVMILSKSQIREIEGFNIYNYLPYLYSKGYYSNIGNYKVQIFNGKERLNIKSISNHVKNDSFITQLFKELLLYENHHLVKFYLLYQVIELLIEKVFNKELTEILNELSLQEKTPFQVKENLGKLANEKDRINKLFTIYTSSDGSKSALMRLCNTLLQNVGRDITKNPPEALYSVRNLFVHEYRSIPISQYPLIEQINNIFEEVIIEILNEVKDIT